MERQASSSLDTHRTPAPYGHACANCARSKCKCITRQVGGVCERCHRLNKECRPAETVRRRNPRKSAVSKTARLEEKLDGLVSLIKSGAQSGGAITSPQAIANSPPPYGSIRIKANIPTHNQSERGSVSSSSNDYIQSVPASRSAIIDSMGSSYLLPQSGFHDISEPSRLEAEEYLINFHTYKSKYFPFIYIPSTTSAHQLRQERPFLWLCIMTAGSKSTSQQQVLGKQIRQTIAQEMVVQSEKNIDFLLGLLTFIGWANYQIHSKPFLAVFTQLAMSLVFDLGLNKPVPEDMQVMPCTNQKHSNPPTPRTMEERRAMLGCFLVTSIISSFLQKIDALRWTPHMDECLKMLDEKKECLNDEILVQQVRLQLIVDKISLVTPHDVAIEPTEYREPTRLYLENLHLQLKRVKASLLAGSRNNEVVFLHLYSTELETALSPTFLHTNQLAFRQQKFLNAGLESIKSWFDVFFTITPSAYIGFPFSIFSQLLRCLLTLYRLMTLDDLTWTEDGYWKTADPLLILDRVINNMEQVATAAGLDNRDYPEGDVFSRVAQMLRSLRPGWEARLGPGGLVLSNIPTSQNVNEMYLPGVEFFDNDWLMDLLLSPTY